MKNNRKLFTLLAGVLFAFFALAFPAQAEEAELRAERFDGLIESFNTSSANRARTLETVYNELRGPHAREMQTMLRNTLSRSNTLILQGTVEALAMLGDPTDLVAIEALLATTDKLEVKTLTIRLLPAFCLTGSERARFNYISYAAGYTRVPSASVLEPLRRPPLTRRGRLDQAKEQMQTRVTRILAGQFDPVGAAMPYVDDRLYSQAARSTIVHYAGEALGNDPSLWSRIWAAQGRDIAYAAPDEVEEIRLSALASLADMGAEGIPELLDAFSRLFSSDSEVLGQAGFETMTTMCSSGFADYEPLAGMNFSRDDALEAENWRERRFASMRRLSIFATTKAAEALPRARDAGVFSAAASCMAAALSYPADFPDPDGLLAAAREAGLNELERMLLMPDLSREQRAAVAMALGEAGSERAVASIRSILFSPYSSPEFGPDGLRMAEAAVDALRQTAIGNQSGRDMARALLLELLGDERMYQPVRPDTPPVGLAHLVLWRLQRLARSTDTSFDPQAWQSRLGW